MWSSETKRWEKICCCIRWSIRSKSFSSTISWNIRSRKLKWLCILSKSEPAQAFICSFHGIKWQFCFCLRWDWRQKCKSTKWGYFWTEKWIILEKIGSKIKTWKIQHGSHDDSWLSSKLWTKLNKTLQLELKNPCLKLLNQV